MKKKTAQANPTREELIKRVIKAKAGLPASGVTSLYAVRFPAYNNKQGKAAVSNVLQYRSVDIKIIKGLEELAESIKAK